MRNKSLFVSALFTVVIGAALLIQPVNVFGWGSAGSDGKNYRSLQETAIFFNNSGATLSAGDVVILDTAGTGVTAGTTLGGYVTRTTSADSVLAVGVVLSTSVADQRPVAVVTKGPADTFCLDATDAVTINTAVGTTTTAGRCGGGSNLGIALEAGDGQDAEPGGIVIWVAPTGAD